jgi:rubredoxin
VNGGFSEFTNEGGKLMADWKCNKCGYTLKADKPPETCPSCKQKCEFLDVSCYIPECGMSGTDTRLK